MIGDKDQSASFDKQLWLKLMTFNGLSAKKQKRWKTWAAQMQKQEVAIACLQECRDKKQGTYTAGNFLIHKPAAENGALGCRVVLNLQV